MLLAAGVFERLGPITGHSSINRARILKLLKSTNVEPKNIIEAGFKGFTPLDEALRRWMTVNKHGLVEFK